MRYILLFLLLHSLSTSAKINPKYANAYERGYDVRNDSVIFPDGSKCLIEEFNNGACGFQWMDVEFCVEQGKSVWHEQNCCEGLSAQLSPENDGQKKCVKKSKSKESHWWDFILNNTMFWIGVLFPFLVIGYIALSIRRKIKNK